MLHSARKTLPGLCWGLLAVATASYAAPTATGPAVDTEPGVVVDAAQENILPTENVVSGDFAGLLGSWTLVAVDGIRAESQDNAATLQVMPDGTVAGFSGVNRYRARLKTAPLTGRISFILGASTMMAGPTDAMAAERIFLERLGAVSTFTINGATLRLYAGDNKALTFLRDSGPQ